MIAGHYYKWVFQLIPLLMRPIWIISGVFIGLNQLPQWVRPYASWNPIVQCVELVRHSFTQDYYIDPVLVSAVYLWQCALGTLFVSLWIYRNNERVLLKR